MLILRYTLNHLQCSVGSPISTVPSRIPHLLFRSSLDDTRFTKLQPRLFPLSPLGAIFWLFVSRFLRNTLRSGPSVDPFEITERRQRSLLWSTAIGAHNLKALSTPTPRHLTSRLVAVIFGVRRSRY